MSGVIVAMSSGKPHWTDGLMMDGRGTWLGNLRNVLYTLRNASEWQGVLSYNEFAARVVTKKPPPWGGQTLERKRPARTVAHRWD